MSTPEQEVLTKKDFAELMAALSRIETSNQHIASLVEASEQRLKSYVDERIAASEQRTSERIAASEQRILAQVEEKLQALEQRILIRVDERIEASEQRLKSYVDERFTISEQRMREHIEQVRLGLSEQIERVETKLLAAFHAWAVPVNGRLRKLEFGDSTLGERLAAIEDRLMALERRPGPPPPYQINS